MKRIAITMILATLIIANWLSPSNKPQQGQPCAPNHRWIEHPANVQDVELYCDPE